MRHGTVKYYDGRKGLGLITPADGSRDLQVDVKALDRAGLGSLTTGQRLQFLVEADRYGRPCAEGLKPPRTPSNPCEALVPLH